MSKRIIAIGAAFVVLFTAICGRCWYIISNRSYAVADSYNSRSFDIYNFHTTIYDRNGVSLNNNTKSLTALIKPDEHEMAELSLLFNKESVNEITQTLKQGLPVIRSIDKYAVTSHIRVVEAIEENNPSMLAKHLINRDYGGLEAALGAATGVCRVNYSVDALGRILAGDDGKIISENEPRSVSISIDTQVQKIVEESCSGIEKGAVVVCDTATSQILASYSKGEDYLNRALNPYAIGSVFKLVVCVAALENNVDIQFDCKNEIIVGDTTFHCQNGKKHGLQNMKQALANSCNCYFIELALKLGAEKIYSTAKSLGFMSDLELFDDFVVKGGAFADESTLKSKGQLALIGFGQGELTDTPVHFCSVISAIADGGVYREPTLTLSGSKGTRIMSSETARVLRNYMRFVVSSGTGAAADYKGKSAGKTATAQSGVYVDGREVLNTFFAGFYPYDNPRYSIVVMCEDGVSGAEDCCPIFRTIVEKLDTM